MMTRGEKVVLFFALYLIAFSIFLHSFKGRYRCILQKDSKDTTQTQEYTPQILDTWTGRHQNVF